MPDIKAPNKNLVLLDSHYQIAQCFFAIEDYWEVLSYCQDFIYLNPTYRDPYFLMAEAYLALGLNTLAEATAEAGFKYGVKHNDWVETANSWLGWGHEILGKAKGKLEQYDDAIYNLKMALKHDPYNSILLRELNTFLEIKITQLESKNK